MSIENIEYSCSNGDIEVTIYATGSEYYFASLWILVDEVWVDTGENWGVVLCTSTLNTANMDGIITGNGEYQFKLISGDGAVESEPFTLDVNCEPEFSLVFEDSGNKHVSFGMDGSFTVDWGDGNTENFTDEVAHHDYVGDGPYYIIINGTPTSLYEVGEGGLNGVIRAIRGLPESVTYFSLNLMPGVATYIDVSNLVNLETFELYNADASLLPLGVELPETNNIYSFSTPNGFFDTAFVNEVIANLHANGIENGNLDLSGQTPAAPPTGLGVLQKSDLISRGWTVNTD